MTDPAEEAANRAIDSFLVREHENLPLACAREALKPIRDLHYRVIADWDDHAFCSECRGPWPCDTARFAYTTEELGNA